MNCQVYCSLDELFKCGTKAKEMQKVCLGLYLLMVHR